MKQQEVAPELRQSWTALRSDLVFLPKLDRMQVETQVCPAEAVEFVRVEPVDEELTVPSAPDVTSADVRAYSGWSAAAADQQRMWALVGTAIGGNKVTRTCPDCQGTRELTCGRCHGRGRVSCTWCGGSGSQSCSSCGGSGSRMVSKTTTNADGTTSTSMESESCSSCFSGRVRCTSCMGSGDETCHPCHGHGRVACATCCPAGTVDVYTRRSFVARSLATQLLPVRLPGYPAPIQLGAGHVQIQERGTPTPYDAQTDQAALADRGITAPDARLFFLRPASVTLHTVRDERAGVVSATFVDGEPAPLLTLHRTTQDPDWTPDREKHKAQAAMGLYVLAPLAVLGSLPLQQPGIGAGVAAALLLGALLLSRHPVRAFRLAFLDVRCGRHMRTATVRCGGCQADLCHECLQPGVRCPQCGQVASPAITHVLEDGRWVAASK